MAALASIFARVILLFLDLLTFAMAIRAILSWFLDEESGLLGTLVLFTEPVVLPFRLLLDRSDTIRSLPIDVPYILTFIVLSLLSGALPAVVY